MVISASLAPVKERSTEVVEELELDVPWITLVWNDPVNLMSYVTYVFETYFGYPRAKAEKLMLDVHTKGKAVGRPRQPRGDGARHRGDARVRALGDLREGRLRVARAFRRKGERYVAKFDEMERGVVAGLMEQTREIVAPVDAGRAARGHRDAFDDLVAGLGVSVRRRRPGRRRCRPTSTTATRHSSGCSRPRTAATSRSPRSSAGSPSTTCATARRRTSPWRSRRCAVPRATGWS